MVRFSPRPLPTLALGTLLILASACSKQSEAQGSKTELPLQGKIQKEAQIRVLTAPVVRQEMVRTLSVTRAIESTQEIEVLPRTSGVIVELLVDEGAQVTEGQILARMDPREAQTQVDDAHLALQEAQNNGPRLNLAVREADERVKRAELTHQQSLRDFERNKTAGFVSSSDLEKLELTKDQTFRDWQATKLSHESAQQDLENQGAIIDRAELAVEKAELSLDFYSIRAPFAGVIAERKVNLGASVGPSAGVFVLTDPTHLRAILFRPQNELFFYRSAATNQGANLNIRVEPEAYDGLLYSGSLRRVSPTVDAKSGSIRVTIDLEQPGPDDSRPALLPGMMVRLHIITERHPDTLVVEKRALRREGDRRHIFVVRDGVARRVEVIEGLLGEYEVEIAPAEGESLMEGEAVVIVGGRELEDGKPVHIANEPEVSPDTELKVTEDQGEALAAETSDSENKTEDTSQVSTPDSTQAEQN
ncbi:MAG: efflux RND transporter periplasmic adaptor subunit [Planctomycetes bacterium]|nr:efflux RND transporter periplasmic adaptor subunit [Planctomycetota bacterium]